MLYALHFCEKWLTLNLNKVNIIHLLFFCFSLILFVVFIILIFKFNLLITIIKLIKDDIRHYTNLIFNVIVDIIVFLILFLISAICDFYTSVNAKPLHAELHDNSLKFAKSKKEDFADSSSSLVTVDISAPLNATANPGDVEGEEEGIEEISLSAESVESAGLEAVVPSNVDEDMPSIEEYPATTLQPNQTAQTEELEEKAKEEKRAGKKRKFEIEEEEEDFATAPIPGLTRVTEELEEKAKEEKRAGKKRKIEIEEEEEDPDTALIPDQTVQAEK
jgi:predicted nuclease with RNAse H fold